VFQKTKPWQPTATAYGRFWVDVPNGPRRRKVVTLGKCRTASIARQRLREMIERKGVNDPATFASRTDATLFRDQAARWLASLSNRTRKPVKPSTISNWRYSLDNWILPAVGHLPLCDVDNPELKKLIAQLTNAGLRGKTIINHCDVLKMVVASAIDDKGHQLHKREWNYDFVQLPIVNENDQERPTLTQAEVETILSNTTGRSFVLFALLLGSGLRISEALALRVEDISQGGRVLSIQRGIWHGIVQTPKTKNGIRQVDIAPRLADLLSDFTKGKSGYVFATRTGQPMVQRNALTYLHRALGAKKGLHSLRRFRTEVLQRAATPEDLLKFWLGHARNTVTELYSRGLSNDLERRREWAEKVGLGFDLDYVLGNDGLQRKVKIEAEQAA